MITRKFVSLGGLPHCRCVVRHLGPRFLLAHCHGNRFIKKIPLASSPFLFGLPVGSKVKHNLVPHAGSLPVVLWVIVGFPDQSGGALEASSSPTVDPIAVSLVAVLPV